MFLLWVIPYQFKKGDALLTPIDRLYFADMKSLCGIIKQRIILVCSLSGFCFIYFRHIGKSREKAKAFLRKLDKDVDNFGGKQSSYKLDTHTTHFITYMCDTFVYCMYTLCAINYLYIK